MNLGHIISLKDGTKVWLDLITKEEEHRLYRILPQITSATFIHDYSFFLRINNHDDWGIPFQSDIKLNTSIQMWARNYVKFIEELIN